MVEEQLNLLCTPLSPTGPSRRHLLVAGEQVSAPAAGNGGASVQWTKESAERDWWGRKSVDDAASTTTPDEPTETVKETTPPLEPASPLKSLTDVVSGSWDEMLEPIKNVVSSKQQGPGEVLPNGDVLYKFD